MSKLYFCGFFNNGLSALVLYKLYHASKVVEKCFPLGAKCGDFLSGVVMHKLNSQHHSISKLKEELF